MFIKYVISNKAKLQAKSVKLADCDFDTDFTVRIIQKLDWKAFWEAAESVSRFFLDDQFLDQAYIKFKIFINGFYI